MFKGLLKPILKLFEDDSVPYLDEDEKKSITMKNSTFLRLNDFYLSSFKFF